MTERDANLAGLGMLILRLGMTALLATNHGWAKFLGATGYLFAGKAWGFVNFVASMGFPLPTFFAVCAALAECVGCLLLAAGLFTRYAAGLIAITMSVAVLHHLNTDLGFESAAMYLLPALLFVLAGPGKFSVDQRLRNRSKAATAAEVITSAA
jgi:putative oxidoreductase